MAGFVFKTMDSDLWTFPYGGNMIQLALCHGSSSSNHLNPPVTIKILQYLHGGDRRRQPGWFIAAAAAVAGLGVGGDGRGYSPVSV